jgi:thymidine phosphorylase
VDARAVAHAALALGAGRRAKGDAVDPAVGVVTAVRTGERVGRGDRLAEIHARDAAAADAAAERVAAAVPIAAHPVAPPAGVREVVG